MKKKIINIPKDYFKDLQFTINTSPLGNKVCCCGYENCTDPECLAECL